jgi:hypothetical protein
MQGESLASCYIPDGSRPQGTKISLRYHLKLVTERDGVESLLQLITLLQ